MPPSCEGNDAEPSNEGGGLAPRGTLPIRQLAAGASYPPPLGPNADQADDGGPERAELGVHGSGRAGTAMSPRMTAVFGAIFGLAAICSIFALLIQVFPERPATGARVRATSAPSVTVPAPVPPPPAPRVRQRVALPGPWRLAELERDPAVRVARGKIERRPFVKALEGAGVAKAQIYRVLKAMEGIRKLDRCGKDDEFTVATKRPGGEIVAFEYEVSATEIYQARADTQGLLRAAKLDMKVRREEYEAAFYVGKDLVRSCRQAGLEDSVVEAINQALSGRTSTEAFDEGGVVRLIAAEETALGLFVRYAGLLAVEYRPADPAQPPLRAYFFEGQKARGYGDEHGRMSAAEGWRSPVPGAPVTSPFNPARLHPVLRRVMAHNGVDYGAAIGAPVYAAYRGTVESVGWRGPSGKLVLIDHPGGVQTGYGHLSRFADGLKKGQKVGTRQLVGYVGSTGRSTGPHLHFSAKKDGRFLDPLSLRLDALRLLPVADRAAFLDRKAELDRRLEAIPMPEPLPEPPAAPAASVEPGAAASSAKPAVEGAAVEEGPPPAASGTASASGSASPLLGPDLSVEPD